MSACIRPSSRTCDTVPTSADVRIIQVGMAGGRKPLRCSAAAEQPHSRIAGKVSRNDDRAGEGVCGPVQDGVVEDAQHADQRLDVDEHVRHGEGREAEVTRRDRLGEGAGAEVVRGERHYDPWEPKATDG
jgi:hypothetical protein